MNAVGTDEQKSSEIEKGRAGKKNEEIRIRIRIRRNRNKTGGPDGRTDVRSLVRPFARSDGRKFPPVFYRSLSPSGPLPKSASTVGKEASASSISF